MKAITLYQPWATLVAIGAKKIETRNWATKYRGPLAIHAGKNPIYIDRHGENYICEDHYFAEVLIQAGILHLLDIYPNIMPLGAIIATCELIECSRIDAWNPKPDMRGWQSGIYYWEYSEQEKAFGNYKPGRYMWFLANIKPLKIPIQVKGARRLWEWEGGGS